MGIFGSHVTYDKVHTALRRQINAEYAEGGEYARLARVGEAILRDHVPSSRRPGDPCPKCSGEAFPCHIITDYVAHPD